MFWISSCISFFLRPKEPGNNNHTLQTHSRPQRPRSPQGATRQDTPDQRPDKQQNRGRHPAIPLGVLSQPGEQLDVGEQVAVDARQHDAGQGVVLERPAGHGLAAALEGHEPHGHEDVPRHVLRAFVAGAPGHDGGGGGDEDGLQGEREAQDPAGSRRRGQDAVEPAEEVGAEGEEEDGEAGFLPPVGSGRET